MKLLTIIAVLVASPALAQSWQWNGAYWELTQCGACQRWGGGVIYYPQQPCQPQQPQQQPRDDGADEGRGAPPQYELRPPLPAPPLATPPLPPAATAPPAKACDCAGKWTAIHARLDKLEQESQTALVSVTATVTNLNQRIAKLESVKPAAMPTVPTMDEIAAAMEKRLTHSAQITLLDGTTKTQTRPLNEALEFNQHSRPAK